MKKYLFSMLALVTLFFAACSEQDDFRGGNADGEVQVSFAVQMPKMATRAVTPGANIDQLVCVVFENGEEKLRQEISGNNNFVFTPQLINGRTYDIVFWAQTAGAWNVANMKEISRNADKDEAQYDAFTYVVKGFTVKESNLTGNNVVLSRPFAQLNVGVTKADWDQTVALGYTPDSVVLTIDNAATAFDAFTGKPAGNDATVEYTLAVPANETITVSNTDYNQVAMCYVLLEEGWPNANVTYAMKDGNDTVTSGAIENVPFDANYKTNIVGTMFTEQPSFEITVNAAFAGDVLDMVIHNESGLKYNGNDKPFQSVFYLLSADDLQTAAKYFNNLAHSNEGNRVTFELMNDIDMSGIEWEPWSVMWIAFNGNGHTISNLTTKEGWRGGLFAYLGAGIVNDLTLQDVTSTGAQAGILAGATEGATANNIIIKGNNKVVYKESATEQWGGVAAVVGVLNNSTINATIAEGATVAIDKNGITTQCTYNDLFTGYLQTNQGTITNNGTVYVEVSDVAEFQAALDAVKENDNLLIRLANDIASTTPVVVTEKNKANIVIDGCNYKYDGQIKIKGNSSRENSTLVIKNINFETSTASREFIWSADSQNGSYWRYAENVTVKNCTFTANGAAVHTAVGVKLQQAYDIKVVDCVATNMHSLINAESCGASITADNVKVVNGKNGLGFNNTKEVVVTNSTIESTVEGGYGIRTKGAEAGYSLYVKDCTVKAFVPVLVRNMTGDDYGITFEGNNVLTTTNGYQVVISDTDYDGTQELATPTGKYTLTGADDFIVYPRQLAVASQSALASAAIENNTTIYLAEGNYVIPAAAKGKTVKFVGIGNPEDVSVAVTKVGTGGENCDFGLDGSNAYFENITITTNSSTYIGYARCNGTYKNCIINGTYTLYGNSTFEDCTFNVSGDVYNIWTWGAKNIKFTGCTFNSDGKALLLYQEGTNIVNLVVEDCVFNDNGGLTDLKAAIEIGDAPYGATPTYNVTVSGTTVNGYEINDKGTNTGTTLWGNKNSMPTERLNVNVDGVDVY